MPVINGEKWACQSCVKGHRVSGCTHTDRELIHINPKGRPVKQCEHCRGARKSKSHHAKCDCGEKKDKDKHKDKGDAKGEHLVDSSADESSNLDPVNNGNRCCCHSGAKCICGLKKENLDLKLDTTKLSLHAARAKPRLTSAHSENTLTVFANGHHKPCHRNNNTAHESGAPYKLNRPHTLHGGAAFASLRQTPSATLSDRSNQRSMDTLSLSNTDFHAMFGSSQRVEDSLPVGSLAGGLDKPNDVATSLFSFSGATLGQESNSPVETQLEDLFSSQQWPWSSSIAPVGQSFSYGSLSTSPSQDCLTSFPGDDWAIPSAGLGNPLWSAGDLPLDPNKLNDSLAQPISHSGESNHHSVAGLTSASSHSDLEELDARPQSTANNILFWDDNPVFAASSAVQTEAFAPTATPSFTETSISTDQSTTVPSTTGGASLGEKGPVFLGTLFGEPSAIAMPSDYNDNLDNEAWATFGQSNFVSGLNFSDSLPNFL
ncbi:uncharacterized protein EI97DRAFT_490101 [Westerdykella ornata]|uniref:Copper-fist domain-containing protein n=1 Tax=Westerdykella ornata TaxID=318751 RepID=A0A6A6JJB5_WESOR|nr:uncharacterized protein EI97DRAFT_490101 [Westerdykella ornata]KAF2276691.1 hypothetical protein EI97DRAFT_490101 [Westerdykella ornata]